MAYLFPTPTIPEILEKNPRFTTALTGKLGFVNASYCTWWGIGRGDVRKLAKRILTK